MTKKSHANAADKTAFSVVLPTVLADELREMAREQSRNRNAQINFIIKNEIARWKAARTPAPEHKKTSVEDRLDALGKIAKARPLRERLNAMPDKKKSA